MADEITLTVDGAEVKTKPGTMIIQAAMDAGLYIPYLCYYPGMKPFGACRMCIVEIEGGRGAPASCTTPVAEGMKVRTNTSEIVGLRKGIMEMLISEHPHGCLTCHRVELCGPSDICLRHVSVNDRCVTCPKNERCELKDTVRYLEMDMDTPLTYNNRHLPLQVADPYFEMDMNLCIVCARCVRACDELRGDDAITLLERSGRSLIGTSHGTSLLESGCEFCGACIDVCPTGALVERDYKWEKAVKTVSSICPNCPVGCQMTLEINKRNRLIRAIPDPHAAANRGQACFKGKFGLDFVNRRERLRKPLIRRSEGSGLEEASWHQALDLVAERLARYGGGQFALVASPRGTNEDSYIAQKFARVVMSTNNVDLSSNTRPELASQLGELLGYPAATNPIWDLEKSACFLVVSSNMTEEQNVVAVPIKRAVKAGASLIVIDQRETELTRYAQRWLRPRPGGELALIGGMLRVIMEESLDDHEFLAESSEGLNSFRNALWSFDLIRVEETTGIPQAEIREAARLFASTKPGAILYGLETVPSSLRRDCVSALVNLAQVTGNLSKPSTGLYPLFTGANEQGSKDTGCVPVHLPGYAPVSDKKARRRFESAWGSSIPSFEGLRLHDLRDAILQGRVKALQIIGDSPNFTNGELGEFVDALKRLELLVIQDSFPSELTDVADVVFPSATFAEKEGTYTNVERRVQLLQPALGPIGEEEADWQILCKIAMRMGAEGFDHQNAEAVFDEIKGLVEIYGGVSYDRLKAGGLQWPCLEGDLTGSSMLYEHGFNGRKAMLAPLKLVEATTNEDPEFPLILARGRILHQPDWELDIVKVDGRNRLKRDDVIEINKQDAADLGIAEGDRIEVVSATDRTPGVARIVGPHRGLVSTTTLFGQLITELESMKSPDPMQKVPGLALVPIRIETAAVVADAAD